MPDTAKPLTPASESRLLRALDKVASLTEGGLHPDEAVANAAREEGVPHTHVDILCRAYNTGRTALQRKSADDAWGRAEAFPIADPARVRDLLYPSREDIKAAVAVTPTSDLLDYTLPPDAWERQKRAEESARLRATPLPKESHPAQGDTHSLEYLFAKTMGALRHAESKEAEARSMAQAAFDRCSSLARDLAGELSKSGSPAVSEMREKCLQLYGPDMGVQALLDRACELAPALRELDRRWLTSKSACVRQLRPAVGPAYDLVRRCLFARDDFRGREAEWQQASKAASELRERYQQSRAEKAEELNTIEEEHPLLGVVRRKMMPTPPVEPEPEHATIDATGGEKTEKEAGMGLTRGLSGFLAGNAWNQAMGHNQPPPVSVDPGIRGLKHDAELDSLNRESVLHELLANDEVLQGHDPRKVLDAYREFQSLAPAASKQRSLMTDYIRKRLEGGPLSYFDLKALTDIEKNLSQVQPAET